jgi:hypothetical protein
VLSIFLVDLDLNRMCMEFPLDLNSLELKEDVPDWARERGITTDYLYALLQDVSRFPDNQTEILEHVSIEDACCVLQAFEYGTDKGLINSFVI